MKKNIIICGGAGFVGVNLLSRLWSDCESIYILDSLTRGKYSYIEKYLSESCHFNQVDLSDFNETYDVFSEICLDRVIHEIWHLAANSDIPAGIEDANIDLKDTFLTTFQLLRCAKDFNIKKFNFASSSAIYGDLGDTILHESVGPLLPISNYGAMKLASEALISSAAESYLDNVNIFRFPNVVGIPATHGVIRDFITKLNDDSSKLCVLGDGTQQKAYLHVTDLVDAMLVISGRQNAQKIEVVNIGPVDKGVTVDWIARQVVSHVSPCAEIIFGIGNKGWVGDVSMFKYSTHRLQSYGWMPKLSSEEAIILAIEQIAQQMNL
jgi:UDP-glucose 4-epimerase